MTKSDTAHAPNVSNTQNNKQANFTPKSTETEFKTIPLSDLLAREFKTNWLIKGILEQGNLVLFFGDSASGSKYVLLHSREH